MRPETILSIQGGTGEITAIEHSCFKCKFFEKIDPGLKINKTIPEGWCHRNPQKVTIEATYWCGEFRIGDPTQNLEELCETK